MILALLRETVFTGEVAVVRDVETERLYHSLSLFDHVDKIFIDILCEQPSLFCQFCHCLKDIIQVLLRVFPAQVLL